MKTHHLFISHSWAYSDAYERLLGMLNGRPYFRFRDYSVRRDDPIHNARTIAGLRAAIRQQMAPCGVVLILGGVYATYSKWIDEEVTLAESGFLQPKPIVAIKPWGNMRMSQPVRDCATRVVGWNTDSVVTAIRDLA
ncbi:MAG: TIR domain-containing protein [Gammaproteobacteria bacterium]|nr:TIR domain-containing protein [Gammaproteobacteria bacterium]